MKLKCQECKKEYTSYHKGKFCSMNCYQRSRWGTYEKCTWCKKESDGKKFCTPACQRSYWNKNDYSVGNKRKRIWERKIEILNKLGGQCIKCGISDIRVLEVNHKERDKKERPAKLVYNWTRRLKEWEKNMSNLELLCANCHRKHTWKQMGWGVGLDKDYYEIAVKRIHGEN